MAPETRIEESLRPLGSAYRSADLFRDDVDVTLDLTQMPSIPSGSVDLLWASHVLEHIENDRDALQEINRVLRDGGIAVLPVPVVAELTAEYSQPCEVEHQHVRAPGHDYFDRYREVFDAVGIIESSDVDDLWQAWIWEDRTHFPTKAVPDRPSQPGHRHSDFVPICFKGNVTSSGIAASALFEGQSETSAEEDR